MSAWIFYRPKQVAGEALQLLPATDYPAGRMDLLLLPGHMILQIHKNIGYPLELDRILGDEPNYAGTSFITLNMLGTYRYGSELLNVAFDPDCPAQLASYGFDKGGAAERTYLVEKGFLKRPLGGLTSQLRANLPGVANSRACSWIGRPLIGWLI